MSTITKTTLPRPFVATQIPASVSEQVETSDGAQAIEVSALFEDAVLQVRHLDNPAGGKVSGLTKGLLGTAAASLAGVFMLFGASYAQVSKERAASERGELAPKRTPHSSGTATDYAAGGLLGLGASALLYGLGRRASERKENEFSIGADAQATFQTTADGLPSARFPLVRSTGTDYELLFTSAMKGDVTVDGKTVSLLDWAAAGRAQSVDAVSGALATRIPQGARFCLQHGHNTFLVSSVARPRHYPVPLGFDWQQQSYTGAVLAGAGLFLGLMFSVPADPKSLALDSFLNEHLTKIMTTPPTAPEEKITFLKAEPVAAQRTVGKAHKGLSGTMGSETAPKVARSYQIKGPKDNADPKLSREVARTMARDMGVLGILTGSRSMALASAFSTDTGLGRDAADALGNLSAAEAGDAYGPSGLSFIGSRTGGGGSGDHTIGMGPIGGIGRPPGYAHSVPLGQMKHKPEGPTVEPGIVDVKGSLDKELIRRVIRRHMNEVKFCYERELTRNQTLQGRVQVGFVIGQAGSVVTSAVQSSTLDNHQAEQCIAAAVRRWDFPKPQLGIVQVSYPFVLKTAGD